MDGGQTLRKSSSTFSEHAGLLDVLVHGLSVGRKSDLDACRSILSQAPLKRLKPRSAMLAKAWLKRELENVGVGRQPVQKNQDDLETLADALKTPSFEPCEMRLIAQLEHDGPLTVHDWLTLDWLSSGLSFEGLSPEEIMSGLPSDDYFYPLVLAIGVRQSLENDRIDALLRRKFPSASQTLPALCERIIRRDALTLTDDDAGDLGLLMSRHVDRVFCEEFASFRAWRLATKHNNWLAAVGVLACSFGKGSGVLVS